MSTTGSAHPLEDAWIAAIHADQHSIEPIGTALVVDKRRMLTCAHVILSPNGEVREVLWISFPKAMDSAACPRRRVASVILASDPPVKDLALLVLDQEIPAGVDVAPLRCPMPSDLVGKQWWAFGFPERDPIGDCADGVVGASLAFGWVRLDTRSDYLVRPGFSGGGLWSPDYGAVVAVVGQAHTNGDGRAITMHRADLCFPGGNLGMLARWSARSAGEVALAEWGWSLQADPESVRHWGPRARGMTINSERGYRFRGRTEALQEINRWLTREVSDRRVLVVTGSPGVGKSAVLGRVVTTSDVSTRASLPPEDDAFRVDTGTVGCAVHVKAKTALEVAGEIARAASAKLPGEPNELANAVREVLERGNRQRFNVVIDALDEAASPDQARIIVGDIVLPLAETCSDAGVQIVVGTRRHDDQGHLISAFGSALTEINLDDSKYFEGHDLAAYALACLQLAGDERPDSPYTDGNVAEPVARKIAELSDRNFLVAGLVARSRGMYDEYAVDPADLAFGATVGSALAAYLGKIRPTMGLSAHDILTGLAFAESPGLPVGLWQTVIQSLYGVRLNVSELNQFAHSSAANFLVESGHGGATPVYRIFHQALNDSLIQTRSRVAPILADELTIAQALITYGREQGWKKAPEYLLRSLPGHSAAAGIIDELLTDDEYLLYADIRRVMNAADRSTSDKARQRIHLLGLTPEAATAGSNERAALFSITEALEGLGTSYMTGHFGATYNARWARARPRGGRAVLSHQNWVNAVCTITVDHRDLIATASKDRMLRIWDPSTGEQRASFDGQEGRINALCTITVADRHLLASARDDGIIQIWDPATGQQNAVLQGHRARITALSPITFGNRHLLASASGDRTVRIWDPATGRHEATLQSDEGWVRALCPITLDGRYLLAGASDDRAIRIWDPATGRQEAVLRGHQGWVNALCPITVDGRYLLASASGDHSIRIWDPATGRQEAVLRGHQGWVNALCPITVDGRHLLASASGDRTVRIWDPATGVECVVLEGHQDWVPRPVPNHPR